MSKVIRKHMCEVVVGVRWDSTTSMENYAPYVDACLTSVTTGSYDWANVVSWYPDNGKVHLYVEMTCVWPFGRTVVAAFDMVQPDEPVLFGWHFGDADVSPSFMPVWIKSVTAHLQMGGRFIIDYTDSDVIKALTTRYCITSADAVEMASMARAKRTSQGS